MNLKSQLDSLLEIWKLLEHILWPNFRKIWKIFFMLSAFIFFPHFLFFSYVSVIVHVQLFVCLKDVSLFGADHFIFFYLLISLHIIFIAFLLRLSASFILFFPPYKIFIFCCCSLPQSVNKRKKSSLNEISLLPMLLLL